MYVCMFVCARASLSCMPVILCMPLCAPQSFTWHQSESSGIVISLPTACCWLKPAVCTLLSFLLPPLLLPCPLLAPHPLHASSTARNSTVAPFCGFLCSSLPKRAPFLTLQKVISSPFFLFSFSSFVSLFFLLSLSLSSAFIRSLHYHPSYRPRSPFSCVADLDESVSLLWHTEKEEGGWRTK